jgi:hypothetical protein
MKKPEFEKIAAIDMYDYEYDRHFSDCGTTPIPEGATHLGLEIDTSGCYYESDMPSYRIHFYKVKQ